MRTEQETTWTNERRADVAARVVGDFLSEDSVAYATLPAVSVIEDLLVCVAHLCDRFNLPPSSTFRDAIRRYRQNLEGDSSASMIAEGISTTLKEIRDVTIE